MVRVLVKEGGEVEGVEDPWTAICVAGDGGVEELGIEFGESTGVEEG